MQTMSELFLANLKNLPVWVKQVIAVELNNDLNTKLVEFSELVESKNLFQSMRPELSNVGKTEVAKYGRKTLPCKNGIVTYQYLAVSVHFVTSAIVDQIISILSQKLCTSKDFMYKILIYLN